MKKITTKIGDIFEVKLDGTSKKYFQYVANDKSQLNSSVIRAFKTKYDISDKPDLKAIVADEADFYAHVVLKWGLQKGLWEKIGNVAEVGTVDVFFRSSRDYGDPSIKISFDWVIWKINEPRVSVGKLEGTYRQAEIGVVMTANDIVVRMQTGKYPGFYPGYE